MRVILAPSKRSTNRLVSVIPAAPAPIMTICALVLILLCAYAGCDVPKAIETVPARPRPRTSRRENLIGSSFFMSTPATDAWKRPSHPPHGEHTTCRLYHLQQER